MLRYDSRPKDYKLKTPYRLSTQHDNGMPFIMVKSWTFNTEMYLLKAAIGLFLLQGIVLLFLIWNEMLLSCWVDSRRSMILL